MKRQLIKNAFGIAGMLILTAVPAFPITSLNFNLTPLTGGSVSNFGVNESGVFYLENFSVTGGLTNYNYSQGSNSSATDFLEVIFNNQTQTLQIKANVQGTGMFSNITAGTLIYNASTSLTQTGGTAVSDTASANGVTSINSTFLSDIDFAAGTSFNLSGGIIGTNQTSVSSDSLTLITATSQLVPEPASLFLFGSGLLAVGISARKRRTRTARI